MKGLYSKYIILKADTKKKIVGDAFVLRPDRDPAAVAALRAYAQATNNKELAKDIIEWVGKNYASEKDGQSVGNSVDILFSHNSIIALWCNNTEDIDRFHLIWRGMAWELPEEYNRLRLLKVFGAIPEKLSEADTINLLVTPYIKPCGEVTESLKIEATE